MKEPFRHSDSVFVGGENRVYIGELPPYMAQPGLPKDVACTKLFKLESREGNMLHFKSGRGYRTPSSVKVLTSMQTGDELCFVEFQGARIKLEASHYMMGGCKLTREEMENYRVYDGRTLKQFLNDKAI